MDVAALYLFALGLVVGLSGALIPGPLLIYTVNESLERGKWTGVKVIVGHAIVEVLIFFVLILGVIEFLSSELFIRAIGLLGGLALIAMAVKSLTELKAKIEIKAKRFDHGVILGGVIFTALNPSFPLWWMTAGTRLLLEGFQRMGYAGMLLVFVGHWVADLGWYFLVSMTTFSSRRFLFEKNWYRNVRITLALALFFIGLYFLTGAMNFGS